MKQLLRQIGGRGVRQVGLRYAVLLCLAAAACADVPAPTPVGLPSGAFDPTTVAIGPVAAVAAPGVMMTRLDLDRLARSVAAELAADYPNRMAGVNGNPVAGSAAIKLVITNYDVGSPYYRLTLPGMARVAVSADVELLDFATRKKLAQYQISRDFAFGDVYSGSTIKDVEKGFAQSVAAIFRKPEAK
jgi:hypothetical protein